MLQSIKSDKTSRACAQALSLQVSVQRRLLRCSLLERCRLTILSRGSSSSALLWVREVLANAKCADACSIVIQRHIGPQVFTIVSGPWGVPQISGCQVFVVHCGYWGEMGCMVLGYPGLTVPLVCVCVCVHMVLRNHGCTVPLGLRDLWVPGIRGVW